MNEENDFIAQLFFILSHVIAYLAFASDMQVLHLYQNNSFQIELLKNTFVSSAGMTKLILLY